MKKLLPLALAGTLLLAPVTAFASEDLETRVAALEEKVAALEAQIGTQPEGVSEAPEQEAVDPGTVETGLVDNECSLSYKRAELAKDYSGEDIAILYFDFFNGSGKTTTAQMTFQVTVFQNGREMESAIPDDISQAIKDFSTEFRSGSETVEVAVARKLQDKSDIIVSLSPFIDWEHNPVEFTVSLE